MSSDALVDDDVQGEHFWFLCDMGSSIIPSILCLHGDAACACAICSEYHHHRENNFQSGVITIGCTSMFLTARSHAALALH